MQVRIRRFANPGTATGVRAGRRRARGFLIAACLLALGLPAAPAGALVCPDDWELDVADLINQERAAVGLAPLAFDVRLGEAARRHSDDMAANEFLSHTGSDGSSPWQRISDAGYPAGSGETAGAGHYTPQMIVDGWMNSSGHRAILLDSRNLHVGVGYAYNPRASSAVYRHLWTATFGRASEAAHTPAIYCGDATECNNGVDDDGDGWTDYPEPGCRTPLDLSEAPDCSDGIDNDGDGLTDHPNDGNCWTPASGSEASGCRDGVDNDQDGLIDYPADPQCVSPDQNSEREAACGIGFELAFLLPALAAWRARRRARRGAATG